MTSQIRRRHRKFQSYQDKSISISLSGFIKTCQIAETSDMATAAEKALAIPELLEAILLALPPLDIVVVQRVNKDFRDAVKASTKIQQKLFYKPRVAGNDESDVEINPLLNQFLRHFSIVGESWVVDSSGRLVFRETRGIVSNEVIHNKDGTYVSIRLSPLGGTALPWPPWDGSYAKMSISNSPINVIIGPASGGFPYIGYADGSDTLTMRDVLEAFWKRSSLASPRY